MCVMCEGAKDTQEDGRGEECVVREEKTKVA